VDCAVDPEGRLVVGVSLVEVADRQESHLSLAICLALAWKSRVLWKGLRQRLDDLRRLGAVLILVTPYGDFRIGGGALQLIDRLFLLRPPCQRRAAGQEQNRKDASHRSLRFVARKQDGYAHGAGWICVGAGERATAVTLKFSGKGKLARL